MKNALRCIILAASLTPVAALADDPQVQIERTIGNLFVVNTTLKAQLDAAQVRIKELEAKEKPDAKQVPSTSPNNGSSGAQPGVR